MGGINLVLLREEIKRTEEDVAQVQAKLSRLHKVLREQREQLKEYCPHPSEFVRDRVVHGDEPGECSSYYVRCTICDKELDRGHVIQNRRVPKKDY